jgi:hypothetical protein
MTARDLFFHMSGASLKQFRDPPHLAGAQLPRRLLDRLDVIHHAARSVARGDGCGLFGRVGRVAAFLRLQLPLVRAELRLR